MKIIHAKNGVRYLVSGLIPCVHGFATRLGGVSSLSATSSLNLAFGRGDPEGVVLENLERFGEAAGFDPESVISLRQMHSPGVMIVTPRDAGLGYYRSCSEGADGYATIERGVTLGVKSADCVPILLCALGRDGMAYAAAALHAGWRGSVSRIAERGVEALVSLGALPGDIRAAIGPAIGGCCFEIGADVRDAIARALGEEACARYVRPVARNRSDSENTVLAGVGNKNTARGGEYDVNTGRGAESGSAGTPGEDEEVVAAGTPGADGKAVVAGKWRADLKGINAHILIGAGVRAENIDISGDCTCCLPGLYFSHRRSGEARGTMLSVINLSVRP